MMQVFDTSILLTYMTNGNAPRGAGHAGGSGSAPGARRGAGPGAVAAGHGAGP